MDFLPSILLAQFLYRSSETETSLDFSILSLWFICVHDLSDKVALCYPGMRPDLEILHLLLMKYCVKDSLFIFLDFLVSSSVELLDFLLFVSFV